MRVVIASGLILVAGCVDASTSIATALGRYGLNASQATCVGERLERNLSVGQLQQLARAAGALQTGDSTPGRLTGGDLLRVASRIEDPRIAIEVAGAARGCGVVGSIL